MAHAFVVIENAVSNASLTVLPMALNSPSLALTNLPPDRIKAPRVVSPQSGAGSALSGALGAFGRSGTMAALDFTFYLVPRVPQAVRTALPPQVVPLNRVRTQCPVALETLSLLFTPAMGNIRPSPLLRTSVVVRVLAAIALTERLLVPPTLLVSLRTVLLTLPSREVQRCRFDSKPRPRQLTPRILYCSHLSSVLLKTVLLSIVNALEQIELPPVLLPRTSPRYPTEDAAAPNLVISLPLVHRCTYMSNLIALSILVVRVWTS